MQIKYINFCVSKVHIFPLKFVSSSYDSITSSQIIAESSIMLAKCFPFSKLHVEGF